MTRRHRWLAVAAALLASTLVGCGRHSPSGPDGRLVEQAQRALERWDTAVAAAGGRPVFAPVGQRTGLIGTWEPEVGDNNKGSLMAGKVVATVGLPAAPAPTAEIRWHDGTTHAAPVSSADDTLRQLVAEGDSASCPECVPLEVTGARLGSAPVQTSRGSATAPVWEYTLRGTAVRITRVAVAPSASVTVTPPAWDPVNAPAGLAVEAASTTVGARDLTVRFTGAPGPASQPCGADYTARAVESANAVVVIVIEHPHPHDGACLLLGAARDATVELAAPLGERAVLEVVQGLPVPVTILP